MTSHRIHSEILHMNRNVPARFGIKPLVMDCAFIMSNWYELCKTSNLDVMEPERLEPPFESGSHTNLSHVSSPIQSTNFSEIG